ncbi:nucleotide sugar dehydrogenase [Methylobacterium sp. NI91]|nr:MULTISPECIES: nucleotide sugar dehydrogenase [unclassified Methylobacterium]QIJ74388.1 nucleotide sugar dehydrogenase [Methylobacterium sp. CLZ]QIJ79294.1 nucleotide sugar dehydrogenase [Methylobacterium sp. NI91]
MSVLNALGVDADTIISKFESREAAIGIIGLGYVGLPLVHAAIQAGFHVIGFDIDEEKIKTLESGRSYIDHVPSDFIDASVRAGYLKATTDFDNLDIVDAIIICVPTPLTKQREPDLSFIENTAHRIAKKLRRGQLVVLESTTWPGTTTEVLQPILESTGLESGKDFFLAFSPEREDPGNKDFSTSRIPKVVGGEGADALSIANAMYAAIVVQTVQVSSTKTAEAVKLTENIFRSVNIALINELKILYSAMGIDVWEVIDGAKTKPFGYMPFYPGPGLGGHCIPIDPFYLTWKAREYELSTKFIELAGEINVAMPNFVISKLVISLDEESGRGLKGTKLLIFGLAYKKNISDIRESPSVKIIELLQARGAIVDYFDPHVSEIPMTREHPSLAGKKSIAWQPDKLSDYAASIIVTDHDMFDYEAIVKNSVIIIDTRNACSVRGLLCDKVVKA